MANEALIFRRKFSLWIIPFASLSEISLERPKKLSSEVCQSVNHTKKQGRNVELQLTSVSRGRIQHPLAAPGVTMLSQSEIFVSGFVYGYGQVSTPETPNNHWSVTCVELSIPSFLQRYFSHSM